MSRSQRTLLLCLCTFAALVSRSNVVAGGLTRLRGHVPTAAIRSAARLGRTARETPMRLAVALKPRDPEGLTELVRRLYDPADPLFHRFLSPAEFRDRFAPSEAAVNEVVSYLTARGARVTNVHANRLVIDVEGEAATVERTFQTEIHDYRADDGRRVRAASSEPFVAEEIAGRVAGVAGLNGFARLRPHGLRKGRALSPRAGVGPRSVNSYMTPGKIKTAYGMNSISSNGAGESLALFELDGYVASDITHYTAQFGLSTVTPQNVLVDGFGGGAGSGRDEVTLDIELALAVAPGLSHLYVYEGPNTDAGVIDTYNRIATDNLAKTVSTSWGLSEAQSGASLMNAENTIFQQMAAQGQALFAAAGDAGAFDDDSHPSTPSVDDPASQPYVTAVGGTTFGNLTTGVYVSETTWADGSDGSGGGGGISSYWPLPSYQAGAGTTANGGSTTRRMIPDVALDSDPNTGYSIYVNNGWVVYGGTSCAAPLWAAYAALVNQGLVAAGQSRLGFANPALYQIGRSSLAAANFHDIADGSTNLYYSAVAGYDLATGLGSMKGNALYNTLVSGNYPPLPPSGMTATSTVLLTTELSWNPVGGATSYALYRASSDGGAYTALSTTLTGTTYTDHVSFVPYYYYYVTATDATGTSGSSTVAKVTPYVPAPGAPTNLTATVLP